MANEYRPFEQRRLTLHEELKTLFGDSVGVYFQPPENINISYPAVIYERYTIDANYANNCVYNTTVEYHITIIDKDPDSLLVDKMSKFRSSRHIRKYVANGLHHDVFKLFY